ncbi:hypothetical protein NQ314_015320 [Rhamnusium bicolor]|uniref:Protein THEM6 n=1 Tax=Rhamnusium bicolor TaxID=1586634 RepID=A0AAV8WYC2_9CUCU|nr:hypothetical protein NQ314_015320 [Rhamnusium bicolor]
MDQDDVSIDIIFSGICLTTDIDNLLNHMNNARYIRELDFAKIDFNERTGLYQRIRSHGGSLVLGATTIRYRRFIKLFSRYYITTKIIYWDEQSIYMEHRFITPTDNFINAIVLCKTRLTNCNADQIITDLLVNSSSCDIESAKTQKPEKTLELAKWIESNEISSSFLRNPKEI